MGAFSAAAALEQRRAKEKARPKRDRSMIVKEEKIPRGLSFWPTNGYEVRCREGGSKEEIIKLCLRYGRRSSQQCHTTKARAQRAVRSVLAVRSALAVRSVLAVWHAIKTALRGVATKSQTCRMHHRRGSQS